MIFSQPVYFLLLSLSVISFFLVPKRWRRQILVISGLIFYGYFGGKYIFLVGGEILLLYFLMKRRSIYSFLFTLVLTVGILVNFKYRLPIRDIFNNLNTFIQVKLDLPIGALAAPLAISFFTFEFIHVAVDRYRGKIKSLSLTKLGAFIFFFPNLVAGPIKRFNDFDGQIDQAEPTPQNIAIGIFRILIGLVKKLVIADTLASISGEILTTSDGVQGATVLGMWLALFSFAWRIYFDFSGYSDIAIGSARLFGIIIPENFTQPYLKANITAFWRNWHRTLTRWLIDYIYIPLGGNRRGLFITCCNTLIVMVVCGLWHGTTLNFFFWGVYHGILLISYRLYKSVRRPLTLSHKLVPLNNVVSTLATFSLVSIGWLLFIAPLDIAIAAFTKMIGATQ